jgi:DNA topoisomerase-1
MLREESQTNQLREDSALSASEAGLRFVSDHERGITRQARGKLFQYRLPSGHLVRDTETLARIRQLAIPPAWTDVWICACDNGHIQATGRDARGRKQYRYHADWQRTRDGAKYERILTFARLLPRLRVRVNADMSKRGLGREKVLATVVYLLETTLIRIGNKEYVRQNKSYGLTTLEDRHVSFAGGEIRFRFRGKSGKEWKLKITDRRIARIVRACQELPGQTLFQYEDDDGAVREVTSADVNGYLRDIAGTEVTAKDFRTWAGTVLAAMALREFALVDAKAATKRNITRAIEVVASCLGNTASVCRKCYVHPEVLNCYLEGTLLETLKQKIKKQLRDDIASLRPEEAATLVLLYSRLGPQKRREKPRKTETDRTGLGAAAGKASPDHHTIPI